MSRVALPQSMTPPADRGWIPSPLYRMTVEQDEALVVSGVFSGRDRIHLINGYLVAKMTREPTHTIADELVGSELTRIGPSVRSQIRPAKPIRRPSRASEPEPDRGVIRGSIRDYEHRHPGPRDIALVVEVADSSLADDRPIGTEVYGPAGIPVYWIVNVVHRQVEVFTDPGPEGYRSSTVYPDGQSVPVAIDDPPLGQIAVADVLPSRPARPMAKGNGT